MGFFEYFFDDVRDFASSVWEGVKEVAGQTWDGLKTAVNTVSKIGQSVLSVVTPIVTSLAAIAPTIGIPLLNVISVASSVVTIISLVAGILKDGETLEDLGEKALEAAEQNINADDYENPEEFMEIVRKTPKSKDPNKYTELEKTLAGMSIAAMALEYKHDISPETYSIFVRYPNFFTDERIKAYTEFALENNENLCKLVSLFSSNSSISDKIQARKLIFEAERKRVTNLDEDKFSEELNDTLVADM